MSTPVKQYLDLYDEASELIGSRPDQRRRLDEAGTLDDVFAPTDYGMNVQRLPIEVDVARSFGCDVPAVSAVPAAVVNDIFSAPARLAERLPRGVHFGSLRSAPGLLPDFGFDDAETRLNDLLWTDGVSLRVDDGVCCEKPLQLVNIFSAPLDLMAVRRIEISLGRNARASILVCDHTQDSIRRYLSAELIKIDLAEGAELSIDFIEESSPLTTRRSTLNARLAADSRLNVTAATLSCGDTRMRASVDIDGCGASATVNGLVIADADQRAAFATRILHHAEHTSSSQLFKYVADGSSHCAFDGRIVVDEAARFTDAHQTNRNMLASPDASMHAEPMLEIYCDEVKCSHGAATGQLDANALFYMRQRGIPEEQARRMLMEAFVGDVISTVHIPGLADRLRHLVERRFAGLGASCADCALTNNQCADV